MRDLPVAPRAPQHSSPANRRPSYTDHLFHLPRGRQSLPPAERLIEVAEEARSFLPYTASFSAAIFRRVRTNLLIARQCDSSQ